MNWVSTKTRGRPSIIQLTVQHWQSIKYFMPRSARLDAPGVIHHIMIRGIEKRIIFKDDKDREQFISRLALLLPKTDAGCYGWVFMPNHAHLLIRSGVTGISTLMRRLLTGYAVYFNRKYNRHGQLFQNRYKSIVCQEDIYLKELVRYIHLNPIRGNIVPNLIDLAKYPYSGHSALMGKRKREWQDTDYILKYFGKTVREGRKEYQHYLESGIQQGHRDDLVGGGLIRSLGGWKEVSKLRLKGKARIKGDERILGSSDFVMEVLNEAEEKLERRYRLKIEGVGIKQVAEKVSKIYGVDPQFILSKGRQKLRVESRNLFCYWCARELGVPLAEIASVLEMSPSSVSYAVERGEKIAEQNNYTLI